MPLALQHSTGHSTIDQILRGLIGAFERAFPGRVRGYYRVGSYADGSATPLSDVDVRAVFKDDFFTGEEERFREVRANCRLLCPIEIDCPALSEQRLWQDENWVHESIAIRSAGVWLYGDDIRTHLPAPNMDAYTRNVTGAPLHFSAQVHRQEPLRYPLAYPDAADEFFGYVSADPDGGDALSTKMLVHLVGFAATCRLALEARQIVVTKRDWPGMYRAYIGDAWTSWLEKLYDRCKNAWGYCVPTSTEERQELRALAQPALTFENDYLAHYRIYCLHELHSSELVRQQLVLLRLRSIVFPDDEMAATLAALESRDLELSDTLADIRRGWAAHARL